MRWSERRTAVRSTFEMTSALSLRATRALVRRRSSCVSLGLMRALWLVLTLLAAAQANAYDRFVSPNGEFEAYTTANFPDGGGMKLFLRRANAPDAGALLAQNGRWIDAKWSSDSHFLAVIDHPDGHIADVYVFGVTAANA